MQQEIYGDKGIYELVLIQKKSLLSKEYKQKTKMCLITDNMTHDEVETFFWENLHLDSPLYGSDVSGSLFEPNEGGQWNLKNLKTCLKDGLGDATLDGINSPFLYFGSFRSMFAWHMEDYNMASLNFQHYGKPKFWYSIARKVIFFISLSPIFDLSSVLIFQLFCLNFKFHFGIETK